MNKRKENKATKMLALGDSQRSVATAVGVSQATIQRYAAKNKALIEEETGKLVSLLPDIVQTISRDINTSDVLSKILSGEIPTPQRKVIDTVKMTPEEVRVETEKENVRFAKSESAFYKKYPVLRNDFGVLQKFMDLSSRTRSDVLKAIGVYPTNAPSIFIQNLFQNGATQVLSPKVMELLNSHVDESLSEIIDAEIIDED